MKCDPIDHNRHWGKETKSGQYMVNLLVANKQIIATNEPYQWVVWRDDAVESVTKNAPEAAVVDLTTG